jgi:hypothetical protein
MSVAADKAGATPWVRTLESMRLAGGRRSRRTIDREKQAQS